MVMVDRETGAELAAGADQAGTELEPAEVAKVVGATVEELA
jgi:hypothetical protein